MESVGRRSPGCGRNFHRRQCWDVRTERWGCGVNQRIAGFLVARPDPSRQLLPHPFQRVFGVGRVLSWLRGSGNRLRGHHSTSNLRSGFIFPSERNSLGGCGDRSRQDAYLSKYGGVVVADINSSNQYVTPSAVSWGTVKLSEGGASELYYNDFVSGSATFNFGTSTCGPYTETAGRYSTVRCKVAPSIYSVAPLLLGTARIVQAGGTITISGVGFGATQCSTCRVAAENPSATDLQVLSWSDSTIAASLPASFGVGIATIAVTTASGSDAMNVMAGLAVQPPAISLSSSNLSFTVLVGGPASGVQNVTVSNGGGGSLSFSVTSNEAWLTASATAGNIAVSVNPSGLRRTPMRV